MTMKMLDAGGIRPIAGSTTGAYELVGGLDGLASMPPRVFAGRAVKLLDYGQWYSRLPDGIEWRFVWIDRDPLEQARSNVKFLSLLAPELMVDAAEATERFAESYVADRQRLLDWYLVRGDVLVSSFEAILADPAAEAARFAEFLPTLDPVAAAAVCISRSASCAPDLAVELAITGVANSQSEHE